MVGHQFAFHSVFIFWWRQHYGPVSAKKWTFDQKASYSKQVFCNFSFKITSLSTRKPNSGISWRVFFIMGISTTFIFCSFHKVSNKGIFWRMCLESNRSWAYGTYHGRHYSMIHLNRNKRNPYISGCIWVRESFMVSFHSNWNSILVYLLQIFWNHQSMSQTIPFIQRVKLWNEQKN